MALRDRSPAVPDGVEMIGHPAPSEHDRPTTRPPLWAWVALAVAIAAVLTLVADRGRSGDDDRAHDPKSSGLGIFDLDEIDLADATPRSDVTFPLFDRDWGLALVVVQIDDVVAVDLDTGVAQILATLEGDAATAPLLEMIAVDDTLYVTTWGAGVLRIAGGMAEWLVTPSAELNRRGLFLGDGHIAIAENEGATGRVSASVRSIVTGQTIDAETPTPLAGAGGSLLVPRAEAIVSLDQDGHRSTWATGELLLAGSTSATWWTCRSDSECTAWAGRADDATAVALDVDTVLDVRASWDATVIACCDITPPRVLSPDGRLASGLVLETNPRSDVMELAGVAIVDLGDGASTFVADPRLPQAWTPDSTALVTTAGGVPTMIDLTTGEMARIQLIASAGALVGNVAAFIPTG